MMTKKAKINTIGHIGVKPKTLAACVIATASLIAMMSVLTPMSQQSANAQMMMGHGSGNMTSDLQELQQNVMANGTINLEQTILEAISSKVNTSLTQAITSAERTVGNDSFAVAAFGGESGGYFAYHIILGTPRMEFYSVLVDPGNGHILSTQKLSGAELDRMHVEHSAEVVESGSGGGIGFPLLIPH
ncbi:MAG TPA: hypothetical protein VKA09_16945 [Nitrososphaeraceae archaeon]|nr:hypothetical protein [Nitrososphaeraceae archaeon]